MIRFHQLAHPKTRCFRRLTMAPYKIAIIIGILILVLGILFMVMMEETLKTMGMIFIAVGGVTIAIALYQQKSSA